MKKVALALLLFLLVPAVYAGDGIIHKASGRVAVKDSYIVVFNAGESNAAERAAELARTHGGKVKHVYRHALVGASFEMTEGQAQGLASNPHVARVQEDALSYVIGDQSNPTWGIDRIDERDLPDDNNYHWDYDGTGVRAFIMDTGIRTTHTNFGGRASWGIDCSGEGQYDGHGHGTHVAGTVGSTTYGVAKNVTLIAVKICTSGGSCPDSYTLCGIDYATGQKQNYPSIPMVANMSIGGSYDSTLNNAVNNSVDEGIFYAVAAGNDSANACNYSPASATDAYTIGSTTSSDSRSSFSNYGTCVDIFAPGSSILSTYNSSDTSTTTMSGTSMASPHACGAGALVLDEHPTWTPYQVMNELDDRATLGRLSNIGTGSPNALLYTLGDGCTITEDPEVSCSDGVDNDCDGLTDGADPDCQGPVECPSGSIDFDGYGLTSYADQNYSNNYSVQDQGATLRLLDNTWIRSTQSYSITSNTVVEFEFASGSQGEIHAIGFDENDTLNDNPRHFMFWGTQSWTGTGKAADWSPQYSGGGSYQTFTIPVGQYFTGSKWLVFTNDNDAGSGNEGKFRCVRVYDTAAPDCDVEESFESGMGSWTTSGTCSTGTFVSGTPDYVENGGVVTQVGSAQSGSNALYSAPNTGGAGTNDIDGGECIATSPTYNVTQSSDVSIWWFHGQRDAGDDPSGDWFYLEYRINGGSWQTMASNGDATMNAAWTNATTTAASGNTIQFRVRASDGSSAGDLVEAGVDNLTICAP